MVRLPAPYCPSNRPEAGLTLIEVLIALAIMSIAMTAIIQSVSHNIRATDYLQTKTMAMWVGQQVLNEARAGLVSVPAPPDQLRQTTTLLQRDWYWQAEQMPTLNPRIQKIRVRVYQRPPEDHDAVSLVTLTTWLSRAKLAS